MALFGIAAGLLRIAFRPFDEGGGDWERFFEFIGAIACGIAGVGAITESKASKVAWPLLYFVIIVVLMTFTIVSCRR